MQELMSLLTFRYNQILLNINKKRLNEIKVENDDFSFVYNVYNSLFILNKFKNFILEYKSKSMNLYKLYLNYKFYFYLLFILFFYIFCNLISYVNIF